MSHESFRPNLYALVPYVIRTFFAYVLLGIIAQAQEFTPPAEGMRLWLKADAGVTADAGGLVSSWANQVAGSTVVAAASATSRPTYLPNILNGWPVVRFGADDRLALPNFMIGAGAGDAFIVVKSDAPSDSYPGVWALGRTGYAADNGYPYQGEILEDFGSTVQYRFSVPAAVVNSPHLYNVSAGADHWVARRNGRVFLSRSSNSVSFTTTPLLGARYPDPYSGLCGDIAEVIIYDRILSDSERDVVGKYLGRKYAFIQLPSAPHELSAVPISNTQVSLAWKGSSANGVQLYQIERKAFTDAEYVTINTVVDSQSCLDDTVAGGGGYSYRVRSVNYAGASAYSDEVAIVMPTGITGEVSMNGLRLWLKGDTGLVAGTLNQWFDQSGLNNHARQESVAAQPLVVANALNGRPAVRFGTDDRLALPNFMIGAGAGDAFVVVKSDAQPDSYPGLWALGRTGYAADNGFPYQGEIMEDFGSTVRYRCPVPAMALNSPNLYNVSADNGHWVLRLNGQALQTLTSNSVSFTATPLLGARYPDAYSGLRGDISEVLIYDRILSESERARVNFYLLRKYNIGLEALEAHPEPGNYSTSQSVSLYSPTANAEIYYTLDGSAPAKGVSALFTGPIAISASIKLRAIAYVGDQIISNELVVLYHVGDAPAQITPLSGISATYFAGPNFSGSSTRRIEPSLNNPDVTTLPGGLVPPVASSLIGSVALTCDNSYELYVNGEAVGTGDNFTIAQSYSNLPLAYGPNVIAVKGINGGGPAGLIVDATMAGQRYKSDTSWRVATNEQAGWKSAGFDHAAWSLANQYGSGNTWHGYTAAGLPSGTDAQWIWSSNNGVAGPVYFRKQFDTRPVGWGGLEQFSAVYEGELLARFSESHSFTLTTNGGVRVWFGDEQVVNEWAGAGGEFTFTRVLQAGSKYPFRVEFQRKSTAPVQLKLEWAGFSTLRQIVPQSQLGSGLPYSAIAGTPTATAPWLVYSDHVVVSLSTTAPASGARFYYTLDGSEPTDSSSLYTGPFTLSHSATLKARTYANGYVESGVCVANYTIDNQPPVLTNFTFNGGAVPVPPALVTTNGTFGITATDASGVKRVDFHLDGVLLASDTIPADGFSAPFVIEPTVDGAHTLTVQAWDNANTPSAILSVPIEVGLPSPPAPAITSPAPGTKVNRESLTVRGTAQKNALVTVYRGGTSVGSTTAAADGTFSLTVTLEPGQNALTATAKNRNVTPSAASPGVSVTYDNTVPAPPSGLTAAPRSGGRIELNWLEPASGLANGYYLFRSPSPIAADATLLPANAIGGILRSRTYTDTPSPDGPDGRYYYRVLTVYSVGTEETLSLPSNQADAVSDRVAPSATVSLQALGTNYDSSGHRFGPGHVQATVTVSERLAAAPFFNLTTTGGALFVDLSAQGETTYTGILKIQDATASGPLGAVFSALDLPGNRGSTITLTPSAVIDTDGPVVTGLVPVALTETGTDELPSYKSIRNEPVAPATAVTLHWQITLNEAPKPDTQPALMATLSSAPASPLPITLTDAGDTNALTWLAALELPATAGTEVETLTLTFSATDDLNNEGSTIVPPHAFQIYKGELPPLAVPAGLTAEALPAGAIYLEWSAVPGASAYVLQVKGPADADFVDLTVPVSTATAYTYTPAADGEHAYRLASVRTENGQDSTSGWSNVATARSDRVAPPAPTNLALTVVPQGVQVSWVAPSAGLADVAGYALYRHTALITSLDGLTAALESITPAVLTAVDTAPAGSTPHYAMVTYDEAGNRSAPVTAYANVALLPVRNLTIHQPAANAAPVVSWTVAPGSSLSGFEFSVDGSPVALTNDQTNNRSYIDSAYASGDRLYQLATVKDGVASPSRSLRMPAVSLSLVAGAELKRGLMNTVHVLVRNESTHPLTEARLGVSVYTGIPGAIVTREHAAAAPLTLAAGAEAVVPVVIGGYDDLPGGTVSAALTLGLAPNIGETVTLVRPASMAVAEGALTIELLPGEFTRGGTGKLRFKLTNPGSEPIDFMSARAQGAQASSEVRIKVSDASGTLLSTTPLQQVVGDDIVSLPSGIAVVRVAAGATYTSAEIEVPVPATAPANVTVSLEIDSVYYDYDGSTEVKLAGPRAQKTVSILETSYTAVLNTGTGNDAGINPPLSNGDVPVIISGQAKWRPINIETPAAPAPGVPVVVSIRNNGFVRTQTVYSDANGAFAYAFQPGATEAGGVYDVWVSHPDALSAPAVPATFTIRRVLVSPLVFNITAPRNYRQTLPVTVSTGAGTSVQNLRAEPVGPLPEAFSLNNPSLASVGGGQTVSLPLSFVGLTTTTAPVDTGTLQFKVLSDDGQGGTFEWATLTLNYSFTEARPLLASPSKPTQIGAQFAHTGSETIDIKNVGFAALENGSVSIEWPAGTPTPPDWIYLQTAAQFGTLEVGATHSIRLVAAPPASTASTDQVYSFDLRVSGDNLPPVYIPVVVTASPSGEGRALLTVLDPFYTLDFPGNTSLHGVVNVPVTLEKESSTGIPTVTRTLFTTLSTGANPLSQVDFEQLPAGRYKLRITSPKHETYESRITIKPGVALAETIQLTYKPVSFSWEVVPITFQDRYEVNITATFETNVPVPVVVVEPGSINLPKMCAGQVFNGEFRITNHGLISADNVTLPLPPSDEYFSYELLGTFGDKIAAGQTVKVAYRVKCLKPLPGDCPELAVDGGAEPPADVPCSTYSKCFTIGYSYTCDNGQVYATAVQVCIYRAFGKCTAIVSGGGGAGSPPFNSNSGGGGVSPYTGGHGGGTSGSSTVANDDCFPRPVGRSCGGAGAGSGQCDENASPTRQSCSIAAASSDDPALANLEAMEALSEVLATTHQYVGSYEDMSIPVPGGSIPVGHGVQGQSWGSTVSDQVRSVPYADGGTQGFALVRGGTAFLSIGGRMGSLESESGSRMVAQPPAAAPAAVYLENGGLNTLTKHADGSIVLSMRNGETIGYDSSGRMVSRGNRAGLLATYQYAADGALSQIFDRNDNVVANVGYDAEGRLETITDAHGRQVARSYDAHGRIHLITRPGGITTTYTYDNWSQVTGVRVHIDGTDAAQDEVTVIEYDNVAETSSVVLPSDKILTGSSRGGDEFRGHVTRISKTVNGVTSSRTFSYKYNAADQTYYTRVVTSTGREEEFVVNANGTLVSKLVNGKKVYAMQEDARVRVRTIGENQRIIEEYDDQARLVRRVNPDGGIETWAHNPVLNKITQYTDPLGFITTYTYDGLGNTLTQTEAAGTPLERVTETEYYTGTLRVKKRTEPDGRQTAYEYDANGRVLRSYDPVATTRETIYTYDARGRVASETDALGRQTHFLYDAAGHIIEVTDPLGRKTLSEYQGDNLIQIEVGRTTTAAGLITRYTYDAAGRRTQERRVDADGTETLFRSFAYDAEGKLLSETNALGQTVSYVYDEDGNPSVLRVPDADGGVSEAFTFYDSQGRPVKSVDPVGKSITTEYNPMGRPKLVIEAAGTPLARATAYKYDLMGRTVEERTYSLAQPETVSTITHTYDALGRLTAAGGNSRPPVTYTYDAGDRILSETDALNRVTSFVYDAHGQLESEHLNGQLVAEYAYDLVGNRIKVVDGEGNHRHFRYDALDRITHESVALHPSQAPPANWWTQPVYLLQETAYTPRGKISSTARYTVKDGITQTATTSFSYDAFDRLVGETDAAGLTVTHVYDAADSLQKTVYPPVASSGEVNPTSTTYLRSPYNAAVVSAVVNRAGHTEHYVHDKNFRVVEQTNSLGGETLTEYDILGRVSKVTLPDEGVTETHYDYRNLPIRIIHPDHVAGTHERIEELAYDAHGRLTDKTGAGEHPMIYRYDLVGNLLELQDANGKITKWTYTARNQVETKTYADTTSHQYTYDDAGRLATRVDALSRTTTYGYNPAGQRTLIDYPTDPDVTYTYDQQGRTLSMIDGSGTTTWTHDAVGRPATETQGRSGRTLTYGYDNYSRRTALTVTAVAKQPWTTRYGYDHAGRLRTILDDRLSSGQPYVYGYENNASLVAQVLSPTGLSTIKTHDTQGRLLTQASGFGAQASLSTHAYTYDKAGQRSTEIANGRTRTFTYDAWRQLTEIATTQPSVANEDLTYAYDGIGNRVEADRKVAGVSTAKTIYDPANDVNQYTGLTGAITDSPDYDLNGNTTGQRGKVLRYDEENRLVEVSDLSTSVIYIYDGLGRRVERIETTSTGTTGVRYVYDGMRVIEELDGSTASTLRSYTRGLDLSGSLQGAGGVGGLLALSQPSGASWTTADYLHDGSGNVTHLVDGSGTVVARYTYGVFGERLTATGALADINPYQFSGKERDAVTGYYHYGYRSYDSLTGRWLSRDPLQEQGGVNLYGFNRNSPINYVDAEGEIPLPLIAAGIGAVAGGLIEGGMAYLNGATGEAIAMAAAQGALQGAVAGLATGAFPGNGLLGFMASGFLSDAAAQHAMMALGLQECYDLQQGLLSALLGGVAGKLAPGASKAAAKSLNAAKAAAKYADTAVQKALQKGAAYASIIAKKMVAAAKQAGVGAQAIIKQASTLVKTASGKVMAVAKKATTALQKTLIKAKTGSGGDFNALALQATKNGDSSFVILGKYNAEKFGGQPYSVVAKNNNATFFELDNWGSLYNQYGDDVWKINESFLNQQWHAGKNIYFSHNPWSASVLGGPNNFFEKEVLHLIDLGTKDFVEVGGGLWKAVR